MGVDYYFYIEQRTDTGWETPDDFVSGYYGSGKKMLEECVRFLRSEKNIYDLFLGEEALFPLHKEIPRDFEDYELYQESSMKEKYKGWIGFEELELEQWNQTSILVSKVASQKWAFAFRKGDQPFPKKVLLELGCSHQEIETLAEVDSLGSRLEMIDYPIVINGYLPQLEYDRKIPVSWKVSLVDYLGTYRMQRLQAARKLDNDQNLRIICLYT